MHRVFNNRDDVSHAEMHPICTLRTFCNPLRTLRLNPNTILNARGAKNVFLEPPFDKYDSHTNSQFAYKIFTHPLYAPSPSTRLPNGRLPTAGRQRAVLRTWEASTPCPAFSSARRQSPTQPPGGRLPTLAAAIANVSTGCICTQPAL